MSSPNHAPRHLAGGAAPAAAAAPAPRKKSSKKRKKKKSPIVPIIIAVIALLLIGLLIFFAVRSGVFTKKTTTDGSMTIGSSTTATAPSQSKPSSAQTTPVPTVAPTPAPTPVPTPAIDPTTVFSEKSIIEFGAAKQGGKGEVSPISWYCAKIDVDNNKMILVAQDGLMYGQFNSSTATNTNWKSSSLRDFLNTIFYNDSFSDEEQAMILTVENKNPANTSEVSEDYVYLMTKAEATSYFADNASRICKPTEYAIKTRHISVTPMPNGDFYWLMPTGQDKTCVLTVSDTGAPSLRGVEYNKYGCLVRPVICVDLQAMAEYFTK